MRRGIFVVVIAGLAAAWAAAARGTRGLPQAETPSARDVYVNKGCHYCHGYDGQGAPSTGPRLAPEPMPADVFFNVVRRPPNVMPAYPPEVLSRDELERIYEYLESIPEPPDVASIPLFAETPEP
jgi:mono/diheme cytochrome c family protein